MFLNFCFYELEGIQFNWNCKKKKGKMRNINVYYIVLFNEINYLLCIWYIYIKDLERWIDI